ncbi:SDR family oxidoreductase [Parendozoicomonas haliclonae]|uniref:2-(S)-hydroxypropyl-CoM dehydrogenase n=1 Tax=Parendozoicomonas haliclonae TaxID=1960125 RepID=A0A1X7AMS2_9GAMM|nr:SDR family oxidoreductase [Parendozoicomonas haliclonae]SMA49365.1 2-(S)-hydroxypropyl-CoM dehydrogenase [Parendozoicomonas haliclonae]
MSAEHSHTESENPEQREQKSAAPVILVTGGARGIGKGISSYLLGCGYRVVMLDILREDGERLARDLAHLGDIRFIRADVADEDQVSSAINRIRNWFGYLNGVVNNAAIAEPYTGPLEFLALEDWQSYIDVNVTGTFLISRATIPLLQQSQGAIVNIASTRWLQSEPQSEAYAASKGAIVSFTHALAISLSGQVRVNCISPGWIAVDAVSENGHLKPVHLTETCHRQHPAGRVGRPDDIASMVKFLLSNESGFITGQNFVIDGGMTRKMVYE